jgi:two-component system response regulator PilR (NtrC family)
VRIISATNRNLEKMVIEGTFREDLYYRLNVLPVALPPLRERKEDISILAQHFLAKFRDQFGKDVRKISSYAMDILNHYDFPGNVRDLEHIIERGVAMESSSIILPDSLTLSTYKKSRNDPLQAIPAELPRGIDLDGYLAEVEKKLLQQALQQAHGVKFKAAELLGISFRSFRYRLLKYGLDTGED